MIHSLPFDFVKNLKVGVETNLPRDFIELVRNDALLCGLSRMGMATDALGVLMIVR